MLEGRGMKKRLISKKEVDHIAWLSRIELSQREKNVFTKQLNEILDFFQKIAEVDVEDVPPTYHVLDMVNVFRKDEVSPSLSEEDALKNAPKKEKRFIKAPRVL